MTGVLGWFNGFLTVMAFFGVTALFIVWSVRRTAGRHADGLPAPTRELPAAEPLRGPVRARYLGTTFAPSTVRRVAAHGLVGRAVVTLVADPEGLRVTGGPAGHWCVPVADLRGAGVASRHAGKGVPAGSVLQVSWSLGGTELVSGFVLDPVDAAAWAQTVQALVPEVPAASAQQP